MRFPKLTRALIAGLSLAATHAGAGVLYDSGGFEPSRFATGNLAGQDAGVSSWTVAGATATVQSSLVKSGSQAVTFSTATGSSFAYPHAGPLTPAPSGSTRFVLVDWDENVQQTTTNLSNFGPMMGIDAYDDSTGPVNRLGTFGVDATTGELITYSTTGGLNITPNDTTVNFNQWNHFEMALDYQTKTYSVYLNGALVQSGIGFGTPTATNFTDADLAGLKDDGSAFNLTGTATFDNYVVTAASSVPEPAALSVVGLGAIGLLSRRSKRRA